MFKEKLKNTTIVEGSKTIFECQTEERNGFVVWFKNELEITKDTENMKMEAFSGCVYKLTISKTSIENGGNYKINKKAICSEAVLDVKGNITKCKILKKLIN